MSFNPTLGLLYVSGQSGGGFTYAVQPNFEYDPKRTEYGHRIRPRPGARAAWRAGAGVAVRVPALDLLGCCRGRAARWR